MLSRLIDAISKLKLPKHHKVEWIIVDSQSSPPLERYFNDVSLMNGIDLRVIREEKAGLTAARIRGVVQSKGEWIVFFDDDNEPGNDYLLQAEKLAKKNSEVGIWGAGTINVSFVQHPQDWVYDKKAAFQDRSIQKCIISSDQKWHKWYPVGTGMVSRRDILFDYVNQVRLGNYNLSDRKRRELSSGGDVQIALHAIKIGYRIGTSPSLKLKHWVSPRKATKRYLIRHAYWVNSSALVAHNQVFSESQISFSSISNWRLWLKLYSVFRMYLIDRGFWDVLLKISQRFGECNARYMAYPNHKKPFLLRLWERQVAT